MIAPQENKQLFLFDLMVIQAIQPILKTWQQRRKETIDLLMND